MRVEKNQLAPDFRETDVFGKSVALSDFRGTRILLTFFRSVGCPVCNLRFHELEQAFSELKAMNLTFIAVYASTPENMLKYIVSRYPNTSELYPIMIPNLSRSLYKLYDISVADIKKFASKK